MSFWPYSAGERWASGKGDLTNLATYSEKLTSRAIDTSKKALETAHHKLEEGKKLREEIQAEYARLKELRDVSLRGIV